MYKPYDVLSEFDDAEGRPTLRDFVPVPELSAAGRLDQDSEGLLLLTDDGELAHRLTHPDYHLPKTYLVQVEGVPTKTALDALRGGVLIKGETTAAAEVELLESEPDLPQREHSRAREPGRPNRMAPRGHPRGEEAANPAHDRGSRTSHPAARARGDRSAHLARACARRMA